MCVPCLFLVNQRPSAPWLTSTPLQTREDDDGTGDELTVPLGTTAFVSGRTMFERLSPEEKSLVVRMKVRYVRSLPFLS